MATVIKERKGPQAEAPDFSALHFDLSSFTQAPLGSTGGSGLVPGYTLLLSSVLKPSAVRTDLTSSPLSQLGGMGRHVACASA